jgi:hypothetical protein
VAADDGLFPFIEIPESYESMIKEKRSDVGK